MEISNKEVAAVEVVAADAKPSLKTLSELELALVGGGCGDISLG